MIPNYQITREGGSTDEVYWNDQRPGGGSYLLYDYEIKTVHIFYKCFKCEDLSGCDYIVPQQRYSIKGNGSQEVLKILKHQILNYFNTGNN